MKHNPRCVVDTNVFISAALNKGSTTRAALLHITEYGILLASEATFHELETRLRRKKFDKYLNDEVRVAFVNWIYGLSTSSRSPSKSKQVEIRTMINSLNLR